MNQKYITELIQKLFPAAMAVICVMIWKDISELKSDVKMLLAQSNVDKTKIENLERFTYGLQHKQQAYEFLFQKIYFKHEEFYDVKKKLKTNIS